MEELKLLQIFETLSKLITREKSLYLTKQYSTPSVLVSQLSLLQLWSGEKDDSMLCVQ